MYTTDSLSLCLSVCLEQTYARVVNPENDS